MQIFLIGFMGSGKSTVGTQLADSLNSSFVDSDQWIERQQGKKVTAIFEQNGEEHFRWLEKGFIAQLGTAPAVISCGGGLPCFNGLMDIICSKGIVIYLEASVETLVQRLRNGRSERPLLSGLSDEALEESIRKGLATRVETYERAQLRIRVGSAHSAEIVEQINILLAELK